MISVHEQCENSVVALVIRRISEKVKDYRSCKDLLNKFKVIIKKSYFWLLIIGMLLTVSYISIIWIEDEITATILNIFAMLGSGIFCSAIVSLIFEINNSKRYEEERKIRRAYILNPIYNSIIAIILKEIMYSSRFCLEFNDDRIINQTPITIKSAIDKTTTFFDEALDIYASDKFKNGGANEKVDVHFYRFIKSGFPEYKGLLDKIKEVVTKSHVYLMDGTLSTIQIDCLNRMAGQIESLVNCEENHNFYDMTLYYKRNVFEFLNDSLNVFEFNTDKEKVFYRYE